VIRVAKRLLVILLGVLALVLLAVAYTQTQLFRDQLRSFILSRVEQAVQAEVSIGRLGGNLVTNLSIDSVSIRVDEGEFVSVQRIELEYDLFHLARKILYFDRVSLVHPHLTVTSGRDGTWNFERVIRPTPDDTTRTPFAWEIVVKHLSVVNGSVGLIDSAALSAHDHELADSYFVEFHNFLLTRVNLETSARIKHDLKELFVSRLSFRSVQPSVEVLQFSASMSVTPHEAHVKNLQLVTSESYLGLDASMKEVDLFDRIDLTAFEMHPVELVVQDSRVNLDELKRFIPQIGFLGGEVVTDLELGGRFGEIQLKKLNLSTGQTTLHLTGLLHNLHRPRDLYLDVEFIESTIYSPDVQAILPGLNLPDYSSVGVSTFDLAFEGKPLDFETTFSISNTAGSVQSTTKLTIGGPFTLIYDGVVSFQGLNIAPFVGNEFLASTLNGSARIEGRGVDVKHLQATATVTLDSSEILGNRVRPSEFAVRADSEAVEGVMTLGIGSMDAELAAALRQSLSDHPSFSIRGRVASLDLAELLRNPAYDSDITMRMDVSGSGLDWGDLNGDFQIDFLSSRYREYQLDSGSVRLLIDQSNREQKRLSLTSNIADFSLTGAYDLGYLAKLISFEVRNLNSALNQKFAVLDSLHAPSERFSERSTMADELRTLKDPLDATFELSIKDLEPVSILTDNRVFDGVGKLTGQVKGDVDMLSLTADLEAEELFYGDAESGFLIQNGSVHLEMDNLKPVEDPLKELEVLLLANAGNLNVSRNELDSLDLSLRFQQGYSQYSASGSYNRDVAFVLNGLANVSEDLLVFTFNELRVEYRDLQWSMDGGSTVGFGIRGARLRNVAMRSDTQVVIINGFVGIDGEIDGSVSINKINLNNLEYFLERQDPRAVRNSLTGVATLNVRASGTLARPEVTGVLEAQQVAFRGLPFGDLRGDFFYDNDIVTMNVVVADKLTAVGASPKLSISGTIPVRYSSKEESSGDEKEIGLSIKSDGVQINILDPLLSTFNDLTGILRCDVTVSGSPSNLRYHGEFSLNDCRFVFEPNNIPYLFSGQFRPEGDRIRVVNATIRNVPSDERPGKRGLVQISGDFGLERFVPTDFDLLAEGELLVVKPETRSSSLSVYGDLYVEIGRSGLSFTGTLEHSRLQGDVFVRSSSLVFPPSQTTERQISDFSIPVVVIDDTSTLRDKTDESLRERYFRTGSQSTGLNVTSQLPERGKSFLDGLEYDLNVATSGPSSEIRLIFSTVPVIEELKANFQGRWSITGDGKRWIGELTIDRASYIFYKQFDATGKLRYSGELMNPELDITALYQGTRTVQNVGDSISRTERVVVSLKIKGTRLKPEHSISMTIDGLDYYSYNGTKSSDIESDAISFIIAGTFPLSQSESNTIAADLRTTVGASLVVGASSLLTSELSEFLRQKTGFIHSIELGYGSQGSFGEAADIRLSGTAFNGLWRYRGTILDSPFNSANVSLLYSFGDIFDNASLRNFMFELERRTEVGKIGLIDDRKEINSARLFYRFSF